LPQRAAKHRESGACWDRQDHHDALRLPVRPSVLAAPLVVALAVARKFIALVDWAFHG
jgi:hypothetical protein